MSSPVPLPPMREKRKKPNLTPLAVPMEARPKYHITDSGTFSEGDFTISREGLVIGNTDSPVTSRPNSSRGSACSTAVSTAQDTPLREVCPHPPLLCTWCHLGLRCLPNWGAVMSSNHLQLRHMPIRKAPCCVGCIRRGIGRSARHDDGKGRPAAAC